MADVVTEFRLDVPETELEDLRARLRNARWPDPETVEDWSQGVPLASSVTFAAPGRRRTTGGPPRRG